jgi:uncharacterized protein (TIGR00251 family)
MEHIISQLKKILKEEETTYLRVRVVPKSSKTEFYEILDDDTWKIRVKAVPEKGKANAELVKYLSKLLGIPKGKISIISGQSDRTKLIRFY